MLKFEHFRKCTPEMYPRSSHFSDVDAVFRLTAVRIVSKIIGLSLIV